MKPYKLFLLSGLYMLLACVCFNAQGGSAINAQGVKGQTADINNRGSGGGVQDNMCKGKKAGDKCSAPGSKEAKCEPIRIHAKDKNTVLSCVVKSCQIDKGYLLELDNKTGRSKGICRTLKFGESQCAKSTNKPTCGTGQKLLPNPIANPNYPEKDPMGAYKDCFCADTNKVTYECGEGTTGNPPTDDTPVTNKEPVTVKDSGTCTKAGFSFKNWLCGKERKNTGDVFYIEDHVTCIAQWTEDKKCPSGTAGQYPKCVCDDTDKIYNEQTQKCECPVDKPANSEGICVAPVKKACPNDATGTYPNCTCKDEDKKYDKDKNECVIDELKKKQKAYDDAKAKEQSLENRTLTAATTAATGIGGMELMQGMAEQSADKDAMADMAAYIETMRCTYGEGKQVKAGPDEIELPGANDQELMNLRGQYLALAADLKERKEALGMKAGIESETIMDRTQTGLYDDENVGIAGGNYASLYRAMMLDSEADQAKIDDEQKTSANRVKYGAIAAGAGATVGVAGNSLVNGDLGDLIKGNDGEKSLDDVATQDEQLQTKDKNKTDLDLPSLFGGKNESADIMGLVSGGLDSDLTK